MKELALRSKALEILPGWVTARVTTTKKVNFIQEKVEYLLNKNYYYLE